MNRQKIKEILLNPVMFYVVFGVGILCLLIYFDSKWLTWDSNKSDVLVEAHGLLFDIILFGILFVIFSKIGERNESIKRYKENIEDIKGWYQPEATFKIIANLKRLLKLKASEIKLTNCYLLKGLLSELDLQKIDFSNSILDEAIFRYSNLRNSIFFNSSVSAADLRYCDLSNSKFTKISAEKIKFNGAKLQNSNFEQAYIIEGDFSVEDFNPTWVDYEEIKMGLILKSYLTEIDFTNNQIIVDLSKSNLSYGTFDRSDFTKAKFNETKLNGASFKDAILKGCNFAKSDLRHVIFDSANLEGITFDTCILDNVNFNNAVLKNISLRNTKFNNCTFENTIFTTSQQQLISSAGANTSNGIFQ